MRLCNGCIDVLRRSELIVSLAVVRQNLHVRFAAEKFTYMMFRHTSAILERRGPKAFGWIFAQNAQQRDGIGERVTPSCSHEGYLQLEKDGQ